MASSTADRTCLFVSEETVRGLLTRLDIFAMVRSVSLHDSVQHGPAVCTRFSKHDVGVKIGQADGSGFAIKVRAGAEGSYLSVAWDDDAQLIGLVESSYLTYYRTAAALLLAPTELSASVSNMLIMGNGPLGHACALLARDLHPDARIRLWSRKSRELSPECRESVDGWWSAHSGCDDFDVVVTCTRSDVPLPLDSVNPRYVSVGGAVDGRRRELPAVLLREVGNIYADDPCQARLLCRDVDALPSGCVIRPFSELEPQESGGYTLAFVCASGGYDSLLAAHVLSTIADGL